jgi:hypothetical protein
MPEMYKVRSNIYGTPSTIAFAAKDDRRAARPHHPPRQHLEMNGESYRLAQSRARKAG